MPSRTWTRDEIASIALEALNELTASGFTTDATPTTLAAIPLDADTTTFIVAQVVGRRTGGSAGTAQDGLSTILTGSFKVVSSAAVLTGTSLPTVVKDKLGWDAGFSVSGQNGLLRVIGAANTNISWIVKYKIVKISN